MDRKTTELGPEFFGFSVKLSERNAYDVRTLEEYWEKNPKDETGVILTTIKDGLKNNYESIPWYRFLEKRKLARLLSFESILKNLTPRQIGHVYTELLKLEGRDIEKKNPGKPGKKSAG